MLWNCAQQTKTIVYYLKLMIQHWLKNQYTVLILICTDCEVKAIIVDQAGVTQ